MQKRKPDLKATRPGSLAWAIYYSESQSNVAKTTASPRTTNNKNESSNIMFGGTATTSGTIPVINMDDSDDDEREEDEHDEIEERIPPHKEKWIALSKNKTKLEEAVLTSLIEQAKHESQLMEYKHLVDVHVKDVEKRKRKHNQKYQTNLTKLVLGIGLYVDYPKPMEEITKQEEPGNATETAASNRNNDDGALESKRGPTPIKHSAEIPKPIVHYPLSTQSSSSAKDVGNKGGDGEEKTSEGENHYNKQPPSRPPKIMGGGHHIDQSNLLSHYVGKQEAKQSSSTSSQSYFGYVSSFFYSGESPDDLGKIQEELLRRQLEKKRARDEEFKKQQEELLRRQQDDDDDSYSSSSDSSGYGGNNKAREYTSKSSSATEFDRIDAINSQMVAKGSKSNGVVTNPHRTTKMTTSKPQTNFSGML